MVATRETFPDESAPEVDLVREYLLRHRTTEHDVVAKLPRKVQSRHA